MNTYYGIRFLRPTQLFSLGLLSVPPHISYQEPAGSPTRRRAQTWRSLFIAPCALREATGKGRVLARLGRVGEIGDFGLVRLATASMDNPS
jgi:hypothetical protein